MCDVWCHPLTDTDTHVHMYIYTYIVLTIVLSCSYNTRLSGLYSTIVCTVYIYIVCDCERVYDTVVNTVDYRLYNRRGPW